MGMRGAEEIMRRNAEKKTDASEKFRDVCCFIKGMTWCRNYMCVLEF